MTKIQLSYTTQIMSNTSQKKNRRRKNGGKCGKVLYKLMSNAVYGKYMDKNENDNDLVAIRKIKVTLTLNKPAYVKMRILDLSEVLMYEFHYDYHKNKYGNNSRLLFTDTDSLIHEIKTDDVYEVFSKDKEMFDFSNYSVESIYHDDTNKLFARKMKDETKGVAIDDFVGLRPEVYSLLVDDSNEHKKTTKGGNKNVITTMSHDGYKDF